MRQESIQIDRPTASYRDGVHRIEAAVNGTPLWFETSDVELRPAAEAFVASLTVAAHHHRRRLESAAPVCPIFAQNLDKVDELFAEWWRFPRCERQLPLGDAAPHKSGGTALLFSGGVDAFHTLVRYPGTIDALVLLLTHETPARALHLEAMVRRVAQARGARAVVVRFNLLYHPAYLGTKWWQAHGAGLSAVGHALADHYGTLLISSASPSFFASPNGSHYRLDPLWSSSRLDVVHWGGNHTRREKLLEIADDPMACAYILPCVDKKTAANCSRCEKCMRTQIALLTCGLLERFTAFEQSSSLAERMLQVKGVLNPIVFSYYYEALDLGLPPELAAAVRYFLRRSRRKLLGQRVKNFLGSLIGRQPNIEREYGRGSPYARSA